MDTTSKQTLRALAEIFPAAKQIDLDVELSLNRGRIEEVHSLTLFGVGPKGTIAITAASREALMAKAMATASMLERVATVHMYTSQISLN